MTSESDIVAMVERDVRIGSRVRATLAGLGGLLMAAMLAVLWATEPTALPARTQIAFAAAIAIGVAWAGFGIWVLTTRHPLYATDSIVAGRLAVAFSGLFTVAGTGVGIANRSEMWWVVLLVGVMMVSLALASLVAALRRRRRLLEIRDRLVSLL